MTITPDRSRKLRASQRVREQLLQSEELRQLLHKDDPEGSAIYTIKAPINTQGDFIVVQRVDYGRERTKGGEYENVCRVAIAIFSSDYDRGLALAELVDALMEAHLTPTDAFLTGADSSLEESHEDYEEGKYIQELIYSIN